MMTNIKRNLFAIFLIVAFTILEVEQVSAAQLFDYTCYDKDTLNKYLATAQLEEIKHENIPNGFLRAILLSPPSSIYDVGLMHLNLDDCAEIMIELKLTDLEKPEDNIKAASYKVSQLFDKYNDSYLVLVNYFKATEEKDSYILDVYRNYLVVKAILESYSAN